MLSSQDSSGAGDEHEGEYPLEDEYEDEEDRLIAQGGMGIPLDEVSVPVGLFFARLMGFIAWQPRFPYCL